MRNKLTKSAICGLLFIWVLACSPENSLNETGIGDIFIKTTTKSQEAEKYFLRGLAALHSFWYPEAERQFTEAQKLDPDYQMAIWGQAMAQNMTFWQRQNLEKGRAFVTKLKQIDSNGLSPFETRLKKSLEFLFDEDVEDKLGRDRSYSRYMKQVFDEFPNEQEAKALYALSLLGTRRNGSQNTKLLMEVAAISQALFEENENHPGAAHYLIHAVDDPSHARLGLRAAQKYSKIAPASSHALHMPSHIFLQIGMWDESIASNIDAYQAGVDWVNANDELTVASRDNHAMEWLVYSYTQKGLYNASVVRIDSMNRDAEITDHRSVKMYRDMTHYRYVMESRQYQWLPVPERINQASYFSYTEACMLNAMILNDLVLGDIGRVKMANDRLSEIIELNETAGQNFRVGLVRIMQKQISAALAWQQKDYENALTLAKEASDMEAKVDVPNGPNFLLKPSFDLYGEFLMYSGKYQEAKEQFLISLERMPNRSLPLLHLGNTYKNLNDPVNAVKYFRMLLNNWEAVDTEIEELRMVNQYLVANKAYENEISSEQEAMAFPAGNDPSAITICKSPYQSDSE